MDGNTTGSAQHKIKTINVEVNMLDAWALQRVELEGKVFKKLLMLSLIIISAVVLVPLLSQMGTDSARSLKSSQAALAANLQKKGQLETHAKEVAPSIERDEVVSVSHRSSLEFLSEIAKVVNAAPDGMYFESFQAEVMGGECLIKVDANAIDAVLGRRFIENASKGNNVLSSNQTSIRQSQLSATGIKFDYSKKVGFN